MGYFAVDNRSPNLKHYGVLGMKWGVRRYENPDGTLTAAGKKRYKKYISTFSKSDGPYMGNKQHKKEDYIYRKSIISKMPRSRGWTEKYGIDIIANKITPKMAGNASIIERKMATGLNAHKKGPDPKLYKAVKNYAKLYGSGNGRLENLNFGWVDNVNDDGVILYYTSSSGRRRKKNIKPYMDFYSVDYNPRTRTYGEIKRE